MNASGVGGTVLVVGEALIDVVTDEAGSESKAPGGSPANVAVGLARLGNPALLLTSVSDDSDGQSIVRHLRGSGVRVLPESFSAHHTPVAYATIGTHGQVHYTFDIAWSLPALSTTPIPEALHVGSYSAFVEPGGTRVLEIVEHARTSRSLISFDPNIRPELLAGRERAVSRFCELAYAADVLKLSDEDAQWLFPSVDLPDLIRRFTRAGPKLAVVTRGARGSLLGTRDCLVEVPSIDADVVDTVGAGDSYMAALLKCVLRSDLGTYDERELRRIGTYCASAAAVTVGRRGADLPWSSEVTEVHGGEVPPTVT